MSQQNACIECGQKTSNPRFCGRSCAAKYNNRKSPKRSPEGKCSDCGAAIPTSRTYCRECLEKREAQELKRPSLFLREETLFSASYASGSELSGDDTVGTFLDLFEELAKLKPRYLPGTDWDRHLQFIQVLKNLVLPNWKVYPKREEIAAVDAPLRELEWVLHQWIESITFSGDSHPLADTFALETAEVISKHARGYSHCGYPSHDGTPLPPIPEQWDKLTIIPSKAST